MIECSELRARLKRVPGKQSLVASSELVEFNKSEY